MFFRQPKRVGGITPRLGSTLCLVLAVPFLFVECFGAQQTNVTISTSANPVGFGQPLTLTATVSPASATGSVSFYDTATLIGTANLNAGIATLSVSNLLLGAHSLLAGYSGDANYAGSFTLFLTENVAAASTVTLASSANPSNFGQRVTLTATVSPSPASGVVTFYDGQTILGVRAVSGGHATLTTGLLQQGARSVWAHYGGDASDAASSSAALAQTVGAIPAQANGFLPPTSSTYCAPCVVADFNGDGKADLATTNGSAVAVLLGKGDGTFQSAVNYSVPVSGSAMVVGDFNGDGLPDLAVAGSGGVSVLLGNVDGTFKLPVTTSSSSIWSSISTADFNGDGNNDLLVSDGNGNIAVLLGRGDGTFQLGASRTLGGTTFAPIIGDFSGDGKADIAVPSTGMYIGISILLGNGDGTFQPALHQNTGFFPPEGTGVVADFNGDGKADLAIIDEIGVAVLVGNGDGTFSAPATYSPPFTPNYIALADLNGDGSLDLVVGSEFGGLATLLGNGDGTFQSAVSYTLSAFTEGPILFADFNGDGRPDIISGSSILLGAMATQFKFTAQPVNAVAGATLPPVAVQAQDPSGNAVWTGSTVNLTSTPAGVNATTVAVNGLATFSNIVINTAGPYTFTAASTALTSASSNVFTISPSTASKLGFSTQPSNGPVGVNLSPAVVVQVQDQYGNLITGSTASITVASIPAGVSASVNAQGGIATFNSLSFGSAGNYTLVASGSGLSSTISNTFTIAGSAGSKLVFSTQPASAVAGATMASVVVQVQDSGGNVVTSSNASVTLTSTGAGINATTTAVNGVATFSNLAVNAAGSYTLSATSTGITSATSNSFAISPAGASKLAFTAQIANGTVGTAIPAVVVQVQDAYGNLVTTSSAAIAVSSAPAGVSATVNAVSGVATFNALVFSAVGTYTLTASSSGLTNTSSSSFTIRGTTTTTLTSPANPSTLGQNLTLTATVAPTPAGGSITFKDGSTTLGTGSLSSGTTTLTLSTLTAGSHSLTAVYGGDTYDIGSTSSTLTQTVTAAGYSIGGKVTLSAASLSGVTVTLTGSQSGSATSDSSGNYSFGVSANGNYTVTPALIGYTFSPSSQSFTNLSSNQTANFSATSTGGIFVSGQVTVSGVGLSGVTINVTGSQTTSTTTNGSGSYNVSLGNGGTYTLAASLAGYSFSGTVTFSNLSTNEVANFSGIAAVGLQFYPVTPCRVADTRTGQGFTGAFGPPLMAATSTRTFPVPSSACGIPSTAVAYSLNFTVIPTAGLGFLTTWPTGQPMPNASTLNSNTGTVVANAAIVPAGQNGAINVYVSNATDVFFDINGYFAPPTSSSLEFYPVTPCRVADTRTNSGFSGAFGPPTMTAASQRSFPIPGSCGIPTTAAAYSLNFTVVPQGGLAFLSTWPTGQSRPNASTLNSFTGTVVANAAIVPAGQNGAVSVYVSNTTDVLFDVNGYFAPPTVSGLQFYPVTPCRIADTRTNSGFNGVFGAPSMPATTQRSFPVPTSSCGIPATAGAYSLNFTVVPPGGLGFLSTWPTGQSMPNVSTLNSNTGTVVANAAIVPAGQSGAISVYVSNPTDVLFDINGYFSQ